MLSVIGTQPQLSHPVTAMISIDFSTEPIEALHHERFHQPHPRVQEKMEAVYHKSQGLPLRALRGVRGWSGWSAC
jgi:hypothetical protein